MKKQIYSACTIAIGIIAVAQVLALTAVASTLSCPSGYSLYSMQANNSSVPAGTICLPSNYSSGAANTASAANPLSTGNSSGSSGAVASSYIPGFGPTSSTNATGGTPAPGFANYTTADNISVGQIGASYVCNTAAGPIITDDALQCQTIQQTLLPAGVQGTCDINGSCGASAYTSSTSTLNVLPNGNVNPWNPDTTIPADYAVAQSLAGKNVQTAVATGIPIPSKCSSILSFNGLNSLKSMINLSTANYSTIASPSHLVAVAYDGVMATHTSAGYGKYWAQFALCLDPGYVSNVSSKVDTSKVLNIDATGSNWIVISGQPFVVK